MPYLVAMPKAKSREPAERPTKDTVIRMRVSDADKRLLEDAARREGRSLSNWLLRAALHVAKTVK